MYEPGMGSGPIATATGVAGVTVLPNTGASDVFVVLSWLTVAVGLLILASTAVRVAAKKHYNA